MEYSNKEKKYHSKELATFDETDRQFLEAICGLITM